jgi:hypothetical protein
MSRSRKQPTDRPGPAERNDRLVPYSPREVRSPDQTGFRQTIVDSGSSAQLLSKRQEQELHMAWVQLRGSWKWLVMIPADPADSTGTLARALCQVGARLSLYPIEFIEAINVDLDQSSRLITRLGTSASGWTPGEAKTPNSSAWTAPAIRTIVALESPLGNPLALPLALAADGVILCVRRGRDRIAVVRQTIDAVGADRIVCSLLVE